MMKRRFFTMACAGVVLGFASSWQVLAAPRPSKKVPLSQSFSYANFKAHIGEVFSVYAGPGLREVVKLKLTAVDEHRLNPHTEQFTARFKGPYGYPLEKGVYFFENRLSGKFQLFLEPAGGGGPQGRFYRAGFNLLR